jgi:hypothetical protein
MSDFDDLLQFIMTGGTAICSGIVVLGTLGFLFALTRGKTFFRSLQFGVAVVMVSLLLPGAMGVGAYAAYNATATFMRNAEEAPGVVVRLEEGASNDGGTVFSAIVEYTPANGTPVEFEDNGEACNPPVNRLVNRWSCFMTRPIPPMPPSKIRSRTGYGCWFLSSSHLFFCSWRCGISSIRSAKTVTGASLIHCFTALPSSRPSAIVSGRPEGWSGRTTVSGMFSTG